MNENDSLSDTKPHLCEQQRHSHKLTIKECLFFSLWLTKIIYCVLAKRRPTSVKKQWHLSYAEHPNVTESRYTWKRCHSDKDDGRQTQAWKQAMQLMVGHFYLSAKKLKKSEVELNLIHEGHSNCSVGQGGWATFSTCMSCYTTFLRTLEGQSTIICSITLLWFV